MKLFKCFILRNMKQYFEIYIVKNKYNIHFFL